VLLLRGAFSRGAAGKSFPARRWIGLGGGLAAFALLVVARDISPFTKDMGAINYSEWLRYMFLWVLSFLVIERLVLLDRPLVRAGLAAGCVGYLVHGMVDFDMFVPGIHQAALLAAACGCGLPVKERPIGGTAKALLLVSGLASAAGLMLWMNGLLPIPDPMTGETLKANGRALVVEGKIEEGVILLHKAADANPFDDETYMILSATYQRMWKGGRKTFRGDDARALALEAAQSASRVNPQSSSHRAQLARLLAASDLEKAVGHAREAVRLYPARPRGHVLLGNLLVKAGRKEEARAEYREALRLNELVMESWLKIRQEDIEHIRYGLDSRP
jgi:tetratricopeptide (TPR) repeat protein